MNTMIILFFKMFRYVILLLLVVLIQLRGRKQVIMFEPFDNSQLYEAHIRQAELSYNSTTHSFSRTHLQDSTSMVMSPVDLSKPDFEVCIVGH